MSCCIGKGCKYEAVQGKTRCQKCLNTQKRYQERKRKQHISSGSCITCGKPPVPGKASCDACSERATRSTMKRYNNNINKGVCSKCGGELNRSSFRCDKCHREHLSHGKELWHNNRKLVLEHYGMKCVCCNITQQEFLEIDHINGDGTEHRLEIGRHIYEWTISNNYPNNLQILCANCNRCKGKYGVCAHIESPRDIKSKAGINQRKRKLHAIKHYGGKCTCCGEDKWPFLEFDHINNDGAACRIENGKLKFSVKWLTNHNLLDKLQLLCSNCNMAKMRFGKCPHQK